MGLRPPAPASRRGPPACALPAELLTTAPPGLRPLPGVLATLGAPVAFDKDTRTPGGPRGPAGGPERRGRAPPRAVCVSGGRPPGGSPRAPLGMEGARAALSHPGGPPRGSQVGCASWFPGPRVGPALRQDALPPGTGAPRPAPAPLPAASRAPLPHRTGAPSRPLAGSLGRPPGRRARPYPCRPAPRLTGPGFSAFPAGLWLSPRDGLFPPQAPGPPSFPKPVYSTPLTRLLPRLHPRLCCVEAAPCLLCGAGPAVGDWK